MECTDATALFEQVMLGVLELVKTTGGDVRADLEDDSIPGFIFRISVDGIEWTRAVWNDDESVGLHNSPTLLARLDAYRTNTKGE